MIFPIKKICLIYKSGIIRYKYIYIINWFKKYSWLDPYYFKIDNKIYKLRGFK